MAQNGSWYNMTHRSERLTKACGRDVCLPAADFLDACETDRDYYDGAEATWLMWGAAQREIAVAKDIFAKAFREYPSEDRAAQLLVESAESASPARLNRVYTALAKKDRTDPFVHAAQNYVRWLMGQSGGDMATKITASLERHSGDKYAFGQWIRTELTFEVWSRGVED